VAACLLIRRVAVDKMVKACPHLIDTTSFARAPRTDAHGFKRPLRLFDRMPVESGPPLSQDKLFWRPWRDTGGKVVGGDRHKVTHMGRWVVASRSPSSVVTDSVSDSVFCRVISAALAERAGQFIRNNWQERR
jgi:hypothetical protein